MPHVGLIKRKDLIYYLKLLGFEGPFAGGNHQFMIKKNLKLILPNPHTGDIGESLLLRILKQAKIDRATWEKL